VKLQDYSLLGEINPKQHNRTMCNLIVVAKFKWVWCGCMRLPAGRMRSHLPRNYISKDAAIMIGLVSLSNCSYVHIKCCCTTCPRQNDGSP